MKYLGVDLGGTNISAGIVEEDLSITAEESCKTEVPSSKEKICDNIIQLIGKVLEKAGLKLGDIPWIGIGCPGAINIKSGVVEYSANLLLSNWPIVDMLYEIMPKKYFLENDANAAALAENMAGAAKGTQNSITMTLGTGIGCGIIIAGKIFGGCNFNAAEIGHTVIVKDGLPCSCGRRGCWEVYASARGLINITRSHLEKDTSKKSLIWDMIQKNYANKISGRMPFAAMRLGDKIGKAIVDEYVDYVGCGVVNIINSLQPEVLCVGGGVSREGDDLILPLKEYVAGERYSKNTEIQTQICQAKFRNEAGIIGAAILGFHH
jgi:glucokinase